MKKWITFDLDETLIQNPFEKWVFPDIETEVNSRAEIKIDIIKEMIKEHEQLLQHKRYIKAYNWDNLLKKITYRNHIHLGINIERLVIKHSTFPKVHLLEENLLDTLQKIKQQGFFIAAITNGLYKYQYPVVKALGLTTVLDGFITPDNTGVAKPDIYIAKELLDQGEIVAHVGDRPDHDVYFANQLGSLSVLIDRDMQGDVIRLSPAERASQNINTNKRCRIKQLESSNLDKMFVPNMVVCSIQELITHGSIMELVGNKSL